MWIKVVGIVLGLMATAINGTSIKSCADNSAPSNVVVEEPSPFGAVLQQSSQSQSGQVAAVDPEDDKIVEEFRHPHDSGTKVSLGLTFLDEFAGPQRQMLIRHLATSAKWHLANYGGKLYATRRFVLGGMWQTSTLDLNLSGDVHETRENEDFGLGIQLSVDGIPRGGGWKEGIATCARPGEKSIDMKVYGVFHMSYLVVESTGAALGIYEESTSRSRSLMGVAISQLKEEFRAVLASPIAKVREFDLSLMPKESMRRGTPEIRLVKDQVSGGIYQVYAYLNPGESGYVHLKIFRGGGNNRVSDIIDADSIECIGWSSDPQVQFFYNTFLLIDADGWVDPFPARFEVWFVPDSGKPERKLMEKYFSVNHFWP